MEDDWGFDIDGPLTDFLYAYQFTIEQKNTDQYWNKKGGNNFWEDKRLVRVIGEGGFGIANVIEKKSINGKRTLSVLKLYKTQIFYGIDQSGNENKNEIVEVVNEYKIERKWSRFVRKNILNRQISPNFAYPIDFDSIPYNEFIAGVFSSGRPFPKNSLWSKDKTMIEYNQNVLENNKIFNRIGFDADANRLEGAVSMIELELGILGTLPGALQQAKGRIQGLDNPNRMREFIRSFNFGIFAGLLSQQISNFQHRDIGGTNIVVQDKKIRTKSIHRKNYKYIFGVNLFEIPDEFQNIIPLFIDFSLSKRIKKPFDKSVPGTQTRLYYRAPELIFITQKPIVYNIYSDVFSTALAIIDFVLEDEAVIFNPYLIQKKEVQDAIQELRAFCQRPSTEFVNNVIKAEFICNSNPEQLLVYAWSIKDAIGWLTDDELLNVEFTNLWKILNKYKKNKNKEGWLWSDPTLNERVDEDGIKLLKSMLLWDSDLGANPRNEIIRSKYFQPLLKKKLKRADTIPLKENEALFGYRAKIIDRKISRKTPTGGDLLFNNIKDPEVKPFVIQSCIECRKPATFTHDNINACSHECLNYVLQDLGK